MSQNPVRYTAESLGALIFTIRGQRAMLDADLASIYGVQTRRLNEQVRRNAERFPGDFMFQLTKQEAANLKSQMRLQVRQLSGRNWRRIPAMVGGENCPMHLPSMALSWLPTFLTALKPFR